MMMRPLLALLALVSFTTAEEPPKAALTQKEIDQGNLQLFDGESTFGWKVAGESSVKDGVWTLGGEKATTATYLIPLPTKNFMIGARVIGNKNITIYGSPNKDAPSIMPLIPTDDFITVGAGGLDILTQFHIVIPEGSKLQIRRFVYLNFSKPHQLFNGKDLTGWKVHDEPKKNLSKFDVTPEGELRVANGPGDLQTTGKYADFLLQFQCKTNGEGLNSGIFFRCIEGQYQNGYECQIQNAMVDNDPAKPKDFGTGAIYRRTPARKIVAKDKEWFSVTLVAHGDQFASWVNGFPVMQWKDERPADDNPRKGLRKAAGHLSIQGHDPTTDILFRKLSIVEFPAAK